jgi:hypothetical protein
MSGDTTTFTYHNPLSKVVDLTIEPWGIIEEVPGGGTATFEINVAPPPEIEFSTTEDGQPYIYVMSEQVRITIDNILKHEFKTSIRPPGSFRILNKILFSHFEETKPRKT